MSPTIFPVTAEFAAEVGDVDLARPLGDADFQAIREALCRFGVLVFPDQRLTQPQHLEFAARFGPLETGTASRVKGAEVRIPEQLADVSNLGLDGKPLPEGEWRRQFQHGNRLWHTDSSFRRVPALASLLYARAIPPVGGLTQYADQRAGYDALPEETKGRLEGLVAEHCILTSRERQGFTEFDEEYRERLPPVPQVVVRTIPETGRKSLYVASHAGRILGMPEAEGRALIDELLAHTTQPQFIYTHRWRINDLVMWDNRFTMHRGTPFDDLRWSRDMQRATVVDRANTCEQEGVDAA